MGYKKIIQKMLANPKDVTPDEVAAALKALGYSQRRKGGSHFVYNRHGSPTFTIPSAGSKVNSVYIRQITKALSEELENV
jgi:predicted RNA binding protein YcfA (HicA-like mRNA interferase family)